MAHRKEEVLLYLSNSIFLQTPGSASPSLPVRNGDRVELPGGSGLTAEYQVGLQRGRDYAWLYKNVKHFLSSLRLKNVSMYFKLESLKFFSEKNCHLLTARRTDIGLRGIVLPSHQFLLPAPLYTAGKPALSGRSCLGSDLWWMPAGWVSKYSSWCATALMVAEQRRHEQSCWTSAMS